MGKRDRTNYPTFSSAVLRFHSAHYPLKSLLDKNIVSAVIRFNTVPATLLLDIESGG